MKELKDNAEMELEHVSSNDNAANILTKALEAYNFKRERRLISSQWGVGKSEASLVVL